MATGEVRRVSREDIQLVQNLIERCLQLYMSQKEVVKFLLQQAKIEPGFTELVWQKLEEENQEFFRAYHLRLIVKEQILRFNELLERQDQLMHQIYSSEYASMHMSDGSQIPSMEENTLPHSLEHADAPIKAETVSEEFNTPMHSAYMSAPSLQQCSPAIALTNRTGRLEAPSDVPFSQNSNVRMVEGLNGGMLKPGGVYVGNNAVVFSTDGNALRAHSTIGDAHVSSYNNVVSNAQPLNQGFSDPETRAFRSLGQIPRNFSLSDLTADFTCSSEILESYPGPIYVEPDHDFLDPHGIREHQGHIGPP